MMCPVRPRRKAGTTLVELSIVMAMVAIVGTMVASFCALTSVRSRQITVSSQVREALCNVEQYLDRWVAANDTSETHISVAGDGKSLQTTNPQSNPFTRAGIPADCVDDLTFVLSGDDPSRPLMVTCTVHYTRPAVGSTPASSETLILYKTFHAAKAAKGEKP